MWQKVAMARALYKDSKVIVFDEPTAAIDAKEEYELFNIFKSLKKQKTVIVVTHRMASVTMADRIIVMDKGTIVGQGTHDKLLKECNKYNSLWNAQSIQYN